MSLPLTRGRLLVLTLAAGAAGLATLLFLPDLGARAEDPAPAAPSAVPVPVAEVQPRAATVYDSFSGRLEAVERVEVRPRVSGAVKTVHFREGALVKQGNLLVTIDPEPYLAELAQAQAQVASAEARLALSRAELERGQRLWESRTVSQRDLDERLNGQRGAEAALRAAQAHQRTAELNLSYTEVRAPIAGRVGKREITEGNLVAAGPAGPVLTTLVSVDPVYAGFSADEEVVVRALRGLDGPGDIAAKLDRIPVLMVLSGEEQPRTGRMQLVDNHVDGRTGTVQVRAVFDNPDGALMPGQFVRLRMGQPKAEPALLVSERAVGTDQDKKFVLVVDAGGTTSYRNITLGAPVDGLRIVTSGLSAGERIVMSGLQKVRPGDKVAPQPVPMMVSEAAAPAPVRN